jgi:hypothetical protein
LKKNIVLLSLFFISLNALAAWDGTVVGKIKDVHVTSAENYGYRVVLDGSPKLCGNNHTWAYLNKSDSNYETYVSVLLAAKFAKTNVTLYTTKSTANEYCHIGYIVIN